MLLAFNFFDIIRVPFGYILEWLYRFTTNYGLALILFAIIVRLVLIPVNAKSKKSMMKMSRLQPRIQEIQRKYADDKQKQNEAIQQLQKEEGASMGCGGCLWSLVPMLILLPLFYVIREPIIYMLHESAETAAGIVEIVKNCAEDVFSGNVNYEQLTATAYISEFKDAIQTGLAEKNLVLSNPDTLNGLNFSFLGIDLSQIPTFNIFGEEWVWSWNHIGGFLMPVLSGGVQVVSMWVSQKTNNSVVADQRGMRDEETAKQATSAKQGKIMMWMMPLMSLWIGFTVPAALSLYWFIGGVATMVENILMTNHYRKIYDAEDAERLKKYQEQQALEAEKERLRAEKRAANPDGITENTSKKKLQKAKQAETAAAKAAAAKEYAARKGIVDEASEEKEPRSGISDRPFAKGRAYDPNRYSSDKTEE